MEEILVPKISVIMPVYNCEMYIRQAVESILNQTFSDFELIIIDDCSTDSTLEIIKSYKDCRINIVEKEQNTGLTNSIIQGVLLAKGEYIARMDGDDISMPGRFKTQLNFLENNPEIILCGSAVEIIGKNFISRYPTTHEMIKIQLCFNASFYHPTIMTRRKVLTTNNYDKGFEPAEDYELWTRLVTIGKLANLDEVLLHYRIHENQTSSMRKQEQESLIFKCQMLMLDKLNISKSFTLAEIKKALNFSSEISFKDVEKTLGIFNQLLDTNDVLQIFDKEKFKEYLKNKKIFYLRNFLFAKDRKWIVNGFKLLKIVSIKEIVVIISPIKRLKKIVKKII